MELDNDTLLARFAAEHYEPNSISDKRRRESDSVLRALGQRLDGRTLVELTPQDLREWQGDELKAGMHPRTLRKKQTMIRSFVGWAYEARLLDFELTMQLKSVNGVRGAHTVAAPRPYKRTEVQAFREALAATYPLLPKRGKGSQSIRALARRGSFSPELKRHARRLQFEAKVALALEEGLRSIEIFNLEISDMHPENECVVVRTAKTKPGEIRDREVPYTPHARLCVQEWLDLRALLAVGHDFPWLTLWYADPSLPERWQNHTKSLAKIGDWNWHRFRHTFATERLRAGMPLEQVQVMMGHARIQQTLAYAEIVNADVRSEAARSDVAFARNIGLEP